MTGNRSNHLKGLSFSEFLEAINTLGKVYNVRVPLIIDGLNESVYWDDLSADPQNRWDWQYDKFIGGEKISLTKPLKKY